MELQETLQAEEERRINKRRQELGEKNSYKLSFLFDSVVLKGTVPPSPTSSWPPRSVALKKPVLIGKY
jgi:hypothetical protein